MPDEKDTAKKPSNLALTLVVSGMALFGLEQYGLGKLKSPNGAPMHIDGTILTILVLAPIVLVLTGAVLFMTRRMRRR